MAWAKMKLAVVAGAAVVLAAGVTTPLVIQQRQQSSGAKPWFDARLRDFFAAKATQARQLAKGERVAAEVWPFFEAGTRGDWRTVTNLWTAMRGRAHQYEGTKPDQTLDKVWAPILEVDLAWEQFAGGTEKYVVAYGNDIINSIPPGSIYLGGTGAGRGLVTAMSQSHAEGKPFYTVTQKGLADGTYLEYLETMYGGKIRTPTLEDLQRCYQEYTTDAQRRLKAGTLQPGESVTDINGRVQVSGQVAVMKINGLIAKVFFDRNPAREFYIEESFPFDWMYPDLTPNGLIMKINREPQPALSDEVVHRDHEYWTDYLKPMLGDWLDYDTPVTKVTAFVEKVYLNHDLRGFTGDPQFIADTWAQKTYSKLRSSIASIYSWRATNARTPAEKAPMSKEADFAFRQAFAVCPSSPETMFRYVTLLMSANRAADARLLVETSLKLEPKSKQARTLLENLKNSRPK